MNYMGDVTGRRAVNCGCECISKTKVDTLVPLGPF